MDIYTLLVTITVLDAVRTLAFCAVAVMVAVYLWSQRTERISRNTERRIGATLAVTGIALGLLYVAIA